MHPSVTALFEYTRSRVTDQDIIDYSPGDPGYPDYVNLWTAIRRSGVIPKETEFDLSEVIGLTGWGQPEEEKDPERVRCYRRFTSSVGIALLHYGNDSSCVRPANYLARDLIIDLDRSCKTHLRLVRQVVVATRDTLLANGFEEDYPFFTFARMILSQIAGSWLDAEAAATQLLIDEDAVRKNESLNMMIADDRFLLALSSFDQVHQDWVSFANDLRNPNSHEDTQLVIDALKAE